ncbi:hypothetical protein DS901_08005 [Loktanella sp. D2R18]|uniref:DUF2163 domain-containing protein n=1 Tax=Rhodobacterales TaxID=204455 RepID=UPI000DEA7214|nr:MULTISPECIES: DUF2163 domain-containing protein [Rhodobacterales]MDO6589714.1 DUF2163 domain-containing protein [Yoonia sp. 1_MG-2023]RBW44340.1 hypothetical protein DS901_08005 [Loktanella sp. D2R18]
MTTALQTHLDTKATHLCYCWAVTRSDGVTLGFTDHDQPIQFDGIAFMPESGLSARALASTTGLSVNNTEAIGVLSADAITEADINAGRYDGAEVTTWLVQWDDPSARKVRFYGTIGEITRASGGFQAELRGLTEALNQPQGRSYLKTCSALLGDGRCGIDLTNPLFTTDFTLTADTDGQHFTLALFPTFNDQWFEQGQLIVQSGAAQHLRGVIKSDRIVGDTRQITLWEQIKAPILAGDTLRFIAGCDRRAETCREKFSNFVNFQGFSDIPGSDWLLSVPRSDGANTGGSLFR